MSQAADRHHGVTVTESVEGIRVIDNIASNIIGVVAVSDDADPDVFPLDTPVFHTSAYRVLGKAGNNGNLKKILSSIVDQADCRVIVVRVAAGNTFEETTKNIIGTVEGDNYTGLQALRRAKAVTGLTPKILGVPDYDTLAVATELVSIAQALNAFCYCKAYGETISEIGEYRKNFGQREIMLIDNDFLISDGVTTEKSTIACVLGARAKLDKEIGFHKSISNTVVNGVIALDKHRTFDLLDKNCEANAINNFDVTTLIRDDGFRIWGNRGCAVDSLVAFEVAVRTAQIVRETIASSFMWALDQPMHPTLLRDVGMTINRKLADYVNNGQMLGARVYVDESLNDTTAITNGIFRFDYEFTPVPPLENLKLAQHLTDTFTVNLVDKTVSFVNSFPVATV